MIYKTIFQQVIDLGTLSKHERTVVKELLSTRPYNCQEFYSKQNNGFPWNFLRQIMLKTAPNELEYQNLMIGPVGTVYRDLVYRMYIKRASQPTLQRRRGRPSKLQNKFHSTTLTEHLQYSPNRLLLDAAISFYYKGKNPTSAEFAKCIGIDPANFTRFLNSMLNPIEGTEGISSKRIEFALRLVNYIPVIFSPQPIPNKHPQNQNIQNPETAPIAQQEPSVTTQIEAVRKAPVVYKTQTGGQEAMYSVLLEMQNTIPSIFSEVRTHKSLEEFIKYNLEFLKTPSTEGVIQNSQ